MECKNCGKAVHRGAACEECQRSPTGDPGAAPEGSGPTPPERHARNSWTGAVLGVVGTALILAAVLAVLAF